MITLTATDAPCQVADLIHHYPNLLVLEWDALHIRLKGVIDVYRTASNFTLDRSYNIEINIPVDSSDLPTVIDLDSAVDTSYPHRYKNGELCLETDTTIRLRFIDGMNLLEWVEEFVESYFFSFEYFKRFGVFPFGERPHGLDGLLNTYQELLDEADPRKAAALLKYCADENYRGHIDCPCGSGKRLRQCHGKALFPLMCDSRKKEVIRKDVEMIRKVIMTYDFTR